METHAAEQYLVQHATPLHRAGRYDKAGPSTCQLGKSCQQHGLFGSKLKYLRRFGVAPHRQVPSGQIIPQIPLNKKGEGDLSSARCALQEAPKLYRLGHALDADVEGGLPVGQALRHRPVAYLVVSSHDGFA